MNTTTYSPYWQRFQQGMFPMFEENDFSPNTDAHWRVIATLDFLKIENDIFVPTFTERGRPKIDRERFARAFIAKAVLNIQTTVALIDRLKVDKVLKRICGWIFEKKLPCEATFSNAFCEFANMGLLDAVHERIIKENLSDDLVFHISRDSTAIEARERAASLKKNEQKDELAVPKRGRPKKGEIRSPKPLSKIEMQQGKSLKEMLNIVSTDCDFGCKTNSQGKNSIWKGYKLHIDSADKGIPISCFISSASVHDSTLSLPLELKTNSRVNSLYTLADSAYDSEIIRSQINSFGKVEIIEINKRRSLEIPQMTTTEKERYKNRTTAERVNASLKDRFGGRTVVVRGAKKVFCHLMFGILALTAESFLNI